MHKLKLDKNIILPAVLTAISIAAIVGLITGFSVLFGVNKKITKIRQDLATVQREWPNKESYMKKSESLKEEIKNMREKFILPQQESAFFAYISTESKNFNIQIKVLKPQTLQDYAASKVGKFKYLPLTVNAAGAFHNFARFMDFLQAGKYFVDVTEMQIMSDTPYNTIEMVIGGLVKED